LPILATLLAQPVTASASSQCFAMVNISGPANVRCRGGPLGNGGPWGSGWGGLGRGVTIETCQDECLRDPECRFAVFRVSSGSCSKFGTCALTQQVGDPFICVEKQCLVAASPAPSPTLRGTTPPSLNPVPCPAMSETDCSRDHWSFAFDPPDCLAATRDAVFDDSYNVLLYSGHMDVVRAWYNAGDSQFRQAVDVYGYYACLGNTALDQDLCDHTWWRASYDFSTVEYYAKVWCSSDPDTSTRCPLTDGTCAQLKYAPPFVCSPFNTALAAFCAKVKAGGRVDSKGACALLL
jgi:hypothetical protein